MIEKLLLIVNIVVFVAILFLLISRKTAKIIAEKVDSLIRKIGERKTVIFVLTCLWLMLISDNILPGIMKGDDLSFHLSRIQGIADGLKSSSFPVLIYPGYINGYGYPNGVFYPDLFFYLPALLVCSGIISPVISYKIMICVLFACIIFSAYFCSYKISRKRLSSLIITIIYSSGSYVLTDIYSRAAIGEAFCFCFFPFIVLGLYQILYQDPYKGGIYFLSGIVGITYSHMVSLIPCVMLTFLLLVMNVKALFSDRRRILALLISGFLSIGISMAFLLPLAEAMGADRYLYNQTGVSTIASRAVKPYYLLFEWCYMVKPYIPPGIGIVFVYLFFVLLKKLNHRFSLSLLISGMIFLLFSSTLFPWGYLGKYLSIIQFPWRFYMPAVLCFCFAYLIPVNDSGSQTVKILIMVLLFALNTFCIFSSFLFYDRYSQIDKIKTKYHAGELLYLPEGIDYEELINRGETVTCNHDLDVSFVRNGTNLIVSYSGKTYDDTYLELPLIYYKGYVAKQDGIHLSVEKGNNGVVRVYPDSENGIINVYYGNTSFRIIGYLISLCSILIGLFLLSRIRKSGDFDKEAGIKVI